MTFGPVQPFGELSTIIGQRGRARLPLARASCWIGLICSTASSSAAAMACMHQLGLVTLDEMRRPAVAAKQLLQFLALDAGQDCRIGDLVAVEVQDRQHRAIGGGIEKLVGMPRRRQRPGFRLAVADDAGDDRDRDCRTRRRTNG